MLSHTVLFDLDGTLTDPKPGITRCIQYALSELGYNPPDANELLALLISGMIFIY
jgi:phosphoglycolate phosphatase